MTQLKLGVVGKNIGYSKSPFIHSKFVKSLGIPVDYTIEDVGEGSFSEKIAELQKRGFLGCNITVPYKEEAFQLADEKTDRAIKAGAANTFVFKAGKIWADNTDGVGFIRDLTENKGYSIAGKRVLICGAGGAVRGILGPLVASRPGAIVLANRTFEKAQTLALAFSNDEIKIQPNTYDHLEGEFDLVIDGTSLNVETLPLSDSVTLGRDSLVYDLKYSPDTKTSMMMWGKSKGSQAFDGMGMLVEQAAEAFKIWTGTMPDTSIFCPS